MAPSKHDFNNAKVWDGTLLKHLVVPFADISQRITPYPSTINPHWHLVEDASHNFVYSTSSPTLEYQNKLTQEGHVKWISHCHPDATPDQLRIIVDLSLWLVMYDVIRDDADRAGVAGYSDECSSLDAMMLKYLQSFQNGKSADDVPDMTLSNINAKPVVDVLERFRKNGIPEDQLANLCQGLINYVQANRKLDTAENLTFEEYVTERRPASGVPPYMAILDWAQGFRLNPKLRQHPIVQQMNICVVDFYWISNDVHSLPKEVLQESPTERNMLWYVIRKNNISVQVAMFETTDAALVAINDLDMVIDCIAECELSQEEKNLLYRYGDSARKACTAFGTWVVDTSRYKVGEHRTLVSPDTASLDKYNLRPACQWLREKYILKKPTPETPPDSNPSISG